MSVLYLLIWVFELTTILWRRSHIIHIDYVYGIAEAENDKMQLISCGIIESCHFDVLRRVNASIGVHVHSLGRRCCLSSIIFGLSNAQSIIISLSCPQCRSRKYVYSSSQSPRRPCQSSVIYKYVMYTVMLELRVTIN